MRQPMPGLSGVTVLCDLLRPDGHGNPGGVDRSAAWLCRAVRHQIRLAAGLDTQLLAPTTVPELHAWLTGLRPADQADALWAARFAALPDGPAWQPIERLVLARLRRQFCLGYELPPWLRHLLDEHEIPYLDVRWHPVRFLDDLMFAVRASCPQTQAALSGIAVPESRAAIGAGLIEAMGGMISAATLPQDTLVVLGQMPCDSTQIVGGGFFDARPRQAEITAICARHRAVLLKPHPQAPAHSLLHAAAASAASGANVLGVTADNIYRLLALPEVISVLTVSSSVAYEAPYFGKTVHALAPPTLRLGWRGEAPAPDAHASLDDEMLSVDFWRLVLAPHAPVTPMDGARLPPKPNRLRIATDSFWNFQEIDTDRVPRPA